MTDDLAIAIDYLRRSRFLVRDAAMMNDDISRHMVLPYGSQAEKDVEIQADKLWTFLEEIDALLARYPVPPDLARPAPAG